METYQYLLKKYGIRVTFEQASEELGLHPQTVRQMCLRGEIKALKAGRKWIFTTKALADYLDNGAKKEQELPKVVNGKRKLVSLT